jgi:hypothetical protein
MTRGMGIVAAAIIGLVAGKPLLTTEWPMTARPSSARTAPRWVTK